MVSAEVCGEVWCGPELSKAADISKAVRIVIYIPWVNEPPWYTFVSLSKAVSVEWNSAIQLTVEEKNWEILRCEERNVQGQGARGSCRWYSDWILVWSLRDRILVNQVFSAGARWVPVWIWMEKWPEWKRGLPSVIWWWRKYQSHDHQEWCRDVNQAVMTCSTSTAVAEILRLGWLGRSLSALRHCGADHCQKVKEYHVVSRLLNP